MTQKQIKGSFVSLTPSHVSVKAGVSIQQSLQLLVFACCADDRRVIQYEWQAKNEAL